MHKLLIANRGEIALRIAATAAEMGLDFVAVYSEDDAQSLHALKAENAVALSGSGPAAYLDTDQLIAAARDTGCDGVHPGYGFLSEDAAFARKCGDADLVFIGPAPETLALLGSKTKALDLAEQLDIPVLPGTRGHTTLEEARAFLAGLGPGGAIMLKAVAGGGGRGMRPVRDVGELADAYAHCANEADKAFGCGDLYVEQLFPRARHVEVQIVGDGTGAVTHLWDRECSIQRQRQKLIEIAPALIVPLPVRRELFRAARRLAQAAAYRGIGTIEFLVNGSAEAGPQFAFMEANPRLQVEHTVTEAVTGLDLVRLQIEIARGARLEDLSIAAENPPEPRGIALQVRVNMETTTRDGTVPSSGMLSAYVPPTGPGIRVDGAGYEGLRTNSRFDSLLAKVIVHTHEPDLAIACKKAFRALGDFSIAGTATNIPFLRALLIDPDLATDKTHTRYLEERLPALLEAAGSLVPKPVRQAPAADTSPSRFPTAPDGMEAIAASLDGVIVSLSLAPGDTFRSRDSLAVIEAMKMEHVVTAPFAGVVRERLAAPGETVAEGQPLYFVEPSASDEEAAAASAEIDLDEIRPDLAAVIQRHAATLDTARPTAVARRRKTGQRTARENMADLVDEGTFFEYGQLTVAARRQRNTLEELIEQTPADGFIAGFGSVNGAQFPEAAARCLVMSYDYTVLAGTQGVHSHKKMDRLIEIAERHRTPTILFCEGGGGRPGDTEGAGPVRSFEYLARMSGRAPLIGIASGRCFAGNAATLGCCDVIIATRNSSIGMGGPAMIEGGGLGVVDASDIGPLEVQAANGVVDIPVEDEAEAVNAAKTYLSYFQGVRADWASSDQRWLRHAIPENRMRAYDIRPVIAAIADTGSVLELRPKFGYGMITALIRIEGRPMGLIANNPKEGGGAITSDGSDKAARFMQICEAFRLPVLSLSDTPGMMVGPAVEKTALVRHCSRLFLIGANLSVPVFSIILRKSYGLGAIAMTGGSFQAPVFNVAWPTGEFSPMGIEGAVKLGFRNELNAISDPQERQARFEQLVAEAYEEGKALTRANTFRVDDVIDPADTRKWIMAGLRAVGPLEAAKDVKLRWIDSW